MATIERDIVMTGKTANGDNTIDFPITRAENVEGLSESYAALDSTGKIPANNLPTTFPGNAATADKLNTYYTYKSFVQQYHYLTSSGTMSGYWKINFNSSKPWMIACTIRLYQGYRYTDVVISGYQYGTNYWYRPGAVVLGSNDDSIEVKFGYDAVGHLWVALPAKQYAGVSVFNITNGYQQVEDWANSISVINQTTLTGTVQETITAYRPRTINEIVPLDKGGTGATTAAAARIKLGAATKPTVTTVTLTAAGWTGDAEPYTQTVTVSGILANETKQLIQPIPAAASQTAYTEAGVYASAQAANSLTFSCSEKPTVDLKVYIVVQEVG